MYVDAFYIDQYEVTNAGYLRFCQATGHRLPFWGMTGFRCGPDYPDHPVVGLLSLRLGVKDADLLNLRAPCKSASLFPKAEDADQR